MLFRSVGDRLKELQRDDPKRYAEIWESLAPFIKIGAMEDDKFADQVADLVLFGTTAQPADAAQGESDTDQNLDPIPGENGRAFTTLSGYRSRLSPEHDKRILYCTDEAGQAGALALWKSQGAEVLLADTFIDTQFIPWLEQRHEELKFQRVDSELDESLQEKESELADAEGKGNLPAIKDAIGDVLVCLINYCALRDIDMIDCLAGAYDEIKDRRGTLMPDGTFVKEA